MISIFYQHIQEATTQTGLSLETVLEKVKSWGCEAVEFSCDELWGKEQEIRDKLNAAGLKVSSIYGQFDFGNSGNPQPGYDLIDLATRMQANKILVIPGFVKIKWKWFRKMAMSNMAEVLKKLCKYAVERQVLVTLEDFDDWIAPYSTIQDLSWFMEKVPGLKLTFDTGNFLYQEQDELKAFEVLNKHIVHVHMKDRSLVKKEGENSKITILGNEMYSSPVGGGIIQMEELWIKFKETGYLGDYTIEHFGSLDQLQDMEKSITWLKKHLN